MWPRIGRPVRWAQARGRAGGRDRPQAESALLQCPSLPSADLPTCQPLAAEPHIPPCLLLRPCRPDGGGNPHRGPPVGGSGRGFSVLRKHPEPQYRWLPFSDSLGVTGGREDNGQANPSLVIPGNGHVTRTTVVNRNYGKQTQASLMELENPTNAVPRRVSHSRPTSRT